MCDILPSIDPHSSATDLLRELAKDCEQAYEPEDNRVSDPTSGILTSILYSDQDEKFYVRIVEYETYVNVCFRGTDSFGTAFEDLKSGFSANLSSEFPDLEGHNDLLVGQGFLNFVKAA